MSRHGPDPERLLVSAVHGTAYRLAQDRGSIADAIARLRGVAGGRDDVLTQLAGVSAGAWSVRPGLPDDLLGAGLLACSIHLPDLAALEHWLTVGQQRTLGASRYGTHP